MQKNAVILVKIQLLMAKRTNETCTLKVCNLYF